MDNEDMKLFDWKFYVETYADLRRAGINTYKKAKKQLNLDCVIGAFQDSAIGGVQFQS